MAQPEGCKTRARIDTSSTQFPPYALLRLDPSWPCCSALLGQPASPRQAQLPSCRGTNMLDEMQGTEAHARILAGRGDRRTPRALLWRIEQGDRPPSYLFGTVHLTDDRVGILSPGGQGRARRLAPAGAGAVDDLSPGNFMKAFVRARVAA